MHDAIKRTLYETLPKSLYIPVGASWVCISNTDDDGEIAVAEMPASSLTEDDIKLRVRMAHLSAKEELKYRDTLRVLEYTLHGKFAEQISKIMGLPIEKVRSLRGGMRETISVVENKIDEFLADPRGSVKLQKSVSKSAQHSGKSMVEPYRESVVAMLKEGKSHWTIHEEICKLGFGGSHSTVDNYIIKLGREGSIESEIAEKRDIANDYFIALPERPAKISVRIYSTNTIYNRVLPRIKESRDNNESKDSPNEQADDAPESKKKQRNPGK
jgi:hypothetical protein